MRWDNMLFLCGPWARHSFHVMETSADFCLSLNMFFLSAEANMEEISSACWAWFSYILGLP
jgi:hypothetical protein